MAIILDTDVIIRGERETFDLNGWLASQRDEEIQIAAITVAELWHGVERASSAYRVERQDYIRKILALVNILPYTETTALEHARIWAELESSGKMIGFYDLIVAATALERGSAVATFNQRHFTQVRGLKVIEPR
ncbi:MAG: PIN domain-containing protein [Candidatus Sulfotelmatobacter sp.]